MKLQSIVLWALLWTVDPIFCHYHHYKHLIHPLIGDNRFLRRNYLSKVPGNVIEEWSRINNIQHNNHNSNKKKKKYSNLISIRIAPSPLTNLQPTAISTASFINSNKRSGGNDSVAIRPTTTTLSKSTKLTKTTTKVPSSKIPTISTTAVLKSSPSLKSFLIDRTRSKKQNNGQKSNRHNNKGSPLVLFEAPPESMELGPGGPGGPGGQATVQDQSTGFHFNVFNPLPENYVQNSAQLLDYLQTIVSPGGQQQQAQPQSLSGPVERKFTKFEFTPISNSGGGGGFSTKQLQHQQQKMVANESGLFTSFFSKRPSYHHHQDQEIFLGPNDFDQILKSPISNQLLNEELDQIKQQLIDGHQSPIEHYLQRYTALAAAPEPSNNPKSNSLFSSQSQLQQQPQQPQQPQYQILSMDSSSLSGTKIPSSFYTSTASAPSSGNFFTRFTRGMYSRPRNFFSNVFNSQSSSSKTAPLPPPPPVVISSSTPFSDSLGLTPNSLLNYDDSTGLELNSRPRFRLLNGASKLLNGGGGGGGGSSGSDSPIWFSSDYSQNQMALPVIASPNSGLRQLFTQHQHGETFHDDGSLSTQVDLFGNRPSLLSGLGNGGGGLLHSTPTLFMDDNDSSQSSPLPPPSAPSSFIEPNNNKNFFIESQSNQHQYGGGGGSGSGGQPSRQQRPRPKFEFVRYSKPLLTSSLESSESESSFEKIQKNRPTIMAQSSSSTQKSSAPSYGKLKLPIFNSSDIAKQTLIESLFYPLKLGTDKQNFDKQLQSMDPKDGATGDQKDDTDDKSLDQTIHHFDREYQDNEIEQPAVEEEGEEVEEGESGEKGETGDIRDNNKKLIHSLDTGGGAAKRKVTSLSGKVSENSFNNIDNEDNLTEPNDNFQEDKGRLENHRMTPITDSGDTSVGSSSIIENFQNRSTVRTYFPGPSSSGWQTANFGMLGLPQNSDNDEESRLFGQRLIQPRFGKPQQQQQQQQLWLLQSSQIEPNQGQGPGQNRYETPDSLSNQWSSLLTPTTATSVTTSAQHNIYNSPIQESNPNENFHQNHRYH